MKQTGNQSSPSKGYKSLKGARRSPDTNARDAITIWTDTFGDDEDVDYGLGDNATVGKKNDGGDSRPAPAPKDTDQPNFTSPRKSSAQPGGGW